MHQTTVRFGEDLWSALEVESARLGVSVAHYVRDAALARLSYTEGFERAHPGGKLRSTRERAATGARIASEPSSAEAVRAQGEPARARARRTREEAGAVRRRMTGARA